MHLQEVDFLQDDPEQQRSQRALLMGGKKMKALVRKRSSPPVAPRIWEFSLECSHVPRGSGKGRVERWWSDETHESSQTAGWKTPLVENTFLAWECRWRVAWVKEPAATRWPVSEWVQHQFGPSLPLSAFSCVCSTWVYCTSRLPRNCSQFFSRFWTTCGQTFMFSSQWENFQTSFGFRIAAGSFSLSLEIQVLHEIFFFWCFWSTTSNNSSRPAFGRVNAVQPPLN